MKKILVTSVGSGVGQSVVDSICKLNKYFIVGCSNNVNIYANGDCHELILVKGVNEEGYLNQILSICESKEIDLVVPGYDLELVLFSKHKASFDAIGVKVLVSRPDLIEISRDKYLWYEYMREYINFVVPTIKFNSFKLTPDSSFFPCIIKPAAGSASQGISIAHNIEDISNIDSRGVDDSYIVQPYLFPREDDENFENIKKAVDRYQLIQKSEISIQYTLTKESKLAGVFVSKNILKSGVPVEVLPIDLDSFEFSNQIVDFGNLLKQLKVIGPVNIQGRITENGLYLFEMNMRFTGITGNRSQFGYNEVAYLIDDFLDLNPQENLNINFNRIGVRQIACRVNSRGYKTKNIVIVGANGSVGVELLNSLMDMGDYNIHLVCRDSSLSKYENKFSNIVKSITALNSPNILSILSEMDALINLAGSLPHLEKKNFYDVIFFHQKLTNLLKESRVPLIINFSSQSVYDQKLNIEKVEDVEIFPSTDYAFQKFFCETLFESINHYAPEIKVVNLRLGRVVGKNVDGVILGGFFKNIIQNLKEEKEVKISNPMNNGNLIHLNDIVSAVKFILSNPIRFNGSETFNLGGVNISFNEYLTIVDEFLDTNFVERNNTNEVTNSSMISIKKLSSYGWEPTMDLRGIVSSLIN